MSTQVAPHLSRMGSHAFALCGPRPACPGRDEPHGSAVGFMRAPASTHALIARVRGQREFSLKPTSLTWGSYWGFDLVGSDKCAFYRGVDEDCCTTLSVICCVFADVNLVGAVADWFGFAAFCPDSFTFTQLRYEPHGSAVGFQIGFDSSRRF